MANGSSNGPSRQEVRDAAPGVLRLAAGAWWRTASWTVETSIKVGSRAVGAAVSGESTAKALDKAGADARGYARRLLGLADGDEADAAGDGGVGEAARQRSLRDRGTELLRQSADVNYDEGAHPAYERILGSLAPDEGRILRFLATEGPQPAVDVRTGMALIPGSQLVAPGLSMIGDQAGCRYLDRVPAYLNNLERLGLIWFSRESLGDALRYQVLEAQPDVIAAKREGGRGRTVRRSIELTPFGEDFCEICLPLETAELDALGGAEAPPDEPRTASARSAPMPPDADPGEVEEESRRAVREHDAAK